MSCPSLLSLCFTCFDYFHKSCGFLNFWFVLIYCKSFSCKCRATTLIGPIFGSGKRLVLPRYVFFLSYEIIRKYLHASKFQNCQGTAFNQTQTLCVI